MPEAVDSLELGLPEVGTRTNRTQVPLEKQKVLFYC